VHRVYPSLTPRDPVPLVRYYTAFDYSQQRVGFADTQPPAKPQKPKWVIPVVVTVVIVAVALIGFAAHRVIKSRRERSEAPAGLKDPLV
jgi:hypothetical protein